MELKIGLLYTTCQDKELLSKILAKARTLKTAHCKLNADRLLDGKAIVAQAQGKNVCCFAEPPVICNMGRGGKLLVRS